MGRDNGSNEMIKIIDKPLKADRSGLSKISIENSEK